MPTTIRNVVLISLLLLVALPSYADGGLEALGDAAERVFILIVWILLSIALFIVGLILYVQKKKKIFANLVYLSFASLSALYYVVFSTFMEIDGSILFDDTIESFYKDQAISQYRTLVGVGIFLLLVMLTFSVYYFKTLRKQR